MNELDTKSLDGKKVIAFRIGAQEFCVDIMSVYEIRCWTPATRLPHAPDYVFGVINLRGVVLPIIDLAARLGFAPTQPTSQHVIIIVKTQNGKTVGLLVDAVTDIVSVSSDQIQPTPSIGSNIAQNFIFGVCVVEERMISLVSVDEISCLSERVAA